jgi:hypothetical protein
MAFINLLDIIYPAGSLYFSFSSVSPANIIGGTWSKVEGKFLLGANDQFISGTEGGEEEHVLASNEAPNIVMVNYSVNYGSNSWSSLTSNAIWTNGAIDGTLPLKLEGAGQPHNNMPPYLAVNIWRRVS